MSANLRRRVSRVDHQDRIRTVRDDRQLIVVLDRPDKSNAVDLPLARELVGAVKQLNDDVDCALFRAEGRSFCAGGDVGSFAAAERPGEYLAELAAVFHEAIRLVETSPVPVVAAVRGGVGGAGLGLVAACDIVVCGESARFRPAYLSLGLTPDSGLSWALPRYFGRARALDLLLTDGAFTAAEAHAVGFVSRVVPDERVEQEAADVLTRLGAGPTAALGRTRRLVRDGVTRPLAEHLDAEGIAIAEAAERPEGREGVRAFTERRQPEFPRP